MKWILPHKPSDMNLTTWAALLARSGGACEIHCSTQCDTKLEVDHRHSRGLGGETSLANCRLICGKANRERGMAQDQKWQSNKFFDGTFNFDALRNSQKFNIENVFECGDLFVGGLRQKLLSYVSLLALTCGAGKTVLMLAFLFAICQEVARRQKGEPRPRRLLWFVHQAELGRQLKLDLEKDIVTHRLTTSLPSIRICDETGDLDTDPGDHDITISCPHALWQSKAQRRSDTEIERVLAAYDVIIWDECDFARDQIARLVRLSPHALKFGLTAAPIDADGKFISGCFVLAASASHAAVFANDKCLAPLLSWAAACQRGYIKPTKYDGFGRFSAAIEQLEDGYHGEKYSLPGSMAAIRSAIHDSIKHEQQMRQKWPETWFSPHIFVPCNTIDEAIELCNQTARDCALEGLSADDGWYPTVLVSASTKREKQLFEKSRSKAELRLFHKTTDLIHPFMRALTNNGRCGPGSSRIMFVVDIAIRGLNHWGLKYVVDVKRSASWSEQVQTLGRTSRLPKHLSTLVGDAMFDSFCHPRLYYPDTGSDERSAARDAWDFILQMDSRIENSGLPSWCDLVDGIEIKPIEQPADAAAPFTLVDQLQIDNALGQLTSSGVQITPERTDAIIRSLPDPQSKNRMDAAREHIRRILTDREYRDEIVKPTFEIIRPISREAPKKPEDYSDEELTQFILDHPLIPNDWIDKLSDTNLRLAVAIMKRDDDFKHYRPVTKIRQLQDADGRPGVLTDVRNSLLLDLMSLGLEYPRIIAPVSWAVNRAASKLCGVKGDSATENDGVLDRPHYHYQFSLPAVKHKIKRLALAELLMRGVVGPAVHLYSGSAGQANAS